MRAIIGGSGLYKLSGLEVTRRQAVNTPFGLPSGALTFGRIDGGPEIVFLARHGYGHTLAPHRINYRANLWALHAVGVDRVVAIATVGGLSADVAPGTLVVPDQLIDYTWGRTQTFFDGDDQPVVHLDMTEPYSASVRAELQCAADACGIAVRARGTYGCTQGPRLETAAEVQRMIRDGCDLVGMTAMPEALLARELNMEYGAMCLVSNYAAGVGNSQRRVAFEENQPLFDGVMQSVQQIIGSCCNAVEG